MESSEFKLIASTYLNGMRVEKGDILREISSKKTVKVLNVYKNGEGHIHLQAEYNAPGFFGLPFQKPIDAFEFLR
jgi:hypothetical protein